MTRDELLLWLNKQLSPELTKDYCPNGLQVEGAEHVKHVVTGVTASQALIEAAIERNAHAILVHHGYFWKGEKPELKGLKKQRLKALLLNDISLFAYHLPLDIHPDFGNNAMLGEVLGVNNVRAMDTVQPNGLVMTGNLSTQTLASEFANRVEERLNRKPLLIAEPGQTIKTVAWCTGGGQGYIDAVLEEDVDLFLSGEISEQTVHTAREMGIAFMAAGHHATERYGVKSLGEKLAQETSLTVEFIDIDNPA